MELLYLSHCVPNPPDKGEKIRAHHILKELSRSHRVHLAAFARHPEEVVAANQLACCASVHVEVLSPRRALARAAFQFAAGGCLTAAFHDHSGMRAYVKGLSRNAPLDAAFVFTTAMAAYAPVGLPLILDMTDVDSEKWLQYARMRWAGALYGIEGRRLRQEEIRFARRAHATILATDSERAVLENFAPGVRAVTLENGVDFGYFDPATSPSLNSLKDRKYIAFVGVMDYFPNADAVDWFVSNVMEVLRRNAPGLEFMIVGRNPSRRVLRLGNCPGVTVTGGVTDVRPYLAGALAIVASLRLARGIQNKVLEALAMGKPVLASSQVCATFGANVPSGVVECRTPEDYAAALLLHQRPEGAFDPSIRAVAASRFTWQRQFRRIPELMSDLSPVHV